MIDDDLQISIESTVKKAVENFDLELVDLIIKERSSDIKIEILADRIGGGITVDECVLVTKELVLIFDEDEALAEKYLIDVSSPGLDRPLTNKADYLRNVGKSITTYLIEPIEGGVKRREYSGKIINVLDDQFIIEIKNGKIEVPFSKVSKTILTI